LDYHEYAEIEVYDDWPACAARFSKQRIFAVSTKGAHRYDANRYGAGDAFLFGPETRGLPAQLLEQFAAERRLRLPMLADRRSLNLSNAVAVVLYEALRQLDFDGCV
jgi:tRNA (cytidine/uridine-2'-O-)-methyltransferase